jgi:hypothetical protein
VSRHSREISPVHAGSSNATVALPHIIYKNNL